MRRVHDYRTLAVIALSAFVATLDNNVVNVALPSIQRDLEMTVPDLEWVVTSYVLGFSSLLLVGGRLADLIGRHRTLVIGMAVFTAASAAAGLAGSGAILVAARSVQGAGAGLLLPAALAVMAADLGGAQRDVAVSLWMGSIASALALGPAVGGLVTEHWSWSWIFYLNVPVGALCIVLLPRGTAVAPADGPPGSRVRNLDLPGAVLSASVLCGITYVLVRGPVDGFTGHPVGSVLWLTLAAAVLLAVVEVRARSPLIDVDLFRDRVFSGGTAAQLLWGVGINGVFFFTSLFLQRILGFSPIKAGLAFLPLAVLVVLTTPLAVQLAAVLGDRVVVSAGLLAVSCGLLLVSRSGGGATYWELQPGFALIGVGSALTTPLVTVVLAAVPPSRAGIAAGMVSAVRESSGIFGVVLVGAVLAIRRDQALRAGRPADAAFLRGYADGLKLAAALVLVGAVVTALTLGRAGRGRGPEGPGGAGGPEADDEPVRGGADRELGRSGPEL